MGYSFRCIVILASFMLTSCQDVEVQLDKFFGTKLSTDITGVKFKVILSSGLTKLNRPENNINDIELGDDSLYAYVSWKGLKKEKYNHKVEFYDENMNLLFINDFNFRTDSGIWNTWSYYNINKFVDEPGIWKIKVFLNNQ